MIIIINFFFFNLLVIIYCLRSNKSFHLDLFAVILTNCLLINCLYVLDLITFIALTEILSLN